MQTQVALPCIEICSSDFGAFNSGKAVTQKLAPHIVVHTGDWCWWSCAKVTGTAEVISIHESNGERFACIQKIY